MRKSIKCRKSPRKTLKRTNHKMYQQQINEAMKRENNKVGPVLPELITNETIFECKNSGNAEEQGESN